MLNVRSDAAWAKFGEIDPYFGVVSHDRFRAGKMEEDDFAEFFRSGEEHVSYVLESVRRHLDPGFSPTRVLDFGCGVGRLVIPFSDVAGEVVGVDVSEGMLREAEANCARRAARNVALVGSDDQMSRVQGTFDLIHSFIVFQHIPPARGLVILRSLLGRLDRGGVGVLHFTYARRASLARRSVAVMRRTIPFVNSLANLAQGRSWSYPLMQMHNYRLNDIFAALNEAGCADAYLSQTDHGGHLGVMLFFRKSAAAGS